MSPVSTLSGIHRKCRRMPSLLSLQLRIVCGNIGICFPSVMCLRDPASARGGMYTQKKKSWVRPDMAWARGRSWLTKVTLDAASMSMLDAMM